MVPGLSFPSLTYTSFQSRYSAIFFCRSSKKRSMWCFWRYYYLAVHAVSGKRAGSLASVVASEQKHTGSGNTCSGNSCSLLLGGWQVGLWRFEASCISVVPPTLQCHFMPMGTWKMMKLYNAEASKPFLVRNWWGRNVRTAGGRLPCSSFKENQP